MHMAVQTAAAKHGTFWPYDSCNAGLGPVEACRMGHISTCGAWCCHGSAGAEQVRELLAHALAYHSIRSIMAGGQSWRALQGAQNMGCVR